MCQLARIAIGSIQKNTDIEPFLGALLELLRRKAIDPQVFQSQSRFAAVDAARVVSGKGQRHLDSWLMSPDACRRSFGYGSQGADLSIVVGPYSDLGQRDYGGGTLDALCNWLELPQSILLDVSRLGDCCLPQVPAEARGVFLTGIASRDALYRWQTYLESHTSLQFLGATMDSEVIRCQWGKRSIAGGCPKELIDLLADQLSLAFRWDRLSALSQETVPSWTDELSITPTFGRFDSGVAIAYDDAFNGYFPDTLDALERQGAKICDFSPLRGDKLPRGCGTVLFGCGRPEHFAKQLARNHCMKQSLRQHAAAGGHVYAEGGGLSYVCRALECRNGRFEMAGLLPAVVRQCRRVSIPVEFRMAGANWLASDETIVRGYENPCWQLLANPGLRDYSDGRLQVVGCRGVIGSRLHLHFASQPNMLRNLLHSSKTVDC